MTPYLY